MSWHPIIVGLDGSEESVQAALFGSLLAQRTGAPCRLVQAIPDYWSTVPPELGLQTQALDRDTIAHSTRLTRETLADRLPPKLLETLHGDVGSPAMVLSREAEQAAASVVVMGAKQRSSLGWLAGSAIPQLIRLNAIPVLAHAGPARPIRRVLAAVDLTASACATIEAAELWCAALGARLRVLHMVEPVPVVPGVAAPLADEEMYRSSAAQVERELRPIITMADTEIVVRRGRAVSGIVSETEAWGADLIVTSSHGKSWMSRLMLGSTSERLLRILPAPVLVLPVTAKAQWEPDTFQAVRHAS